MNTLREECNENMIFAYCTQCKKSFTEKINFCPHCGYKLENLFQEAVGQFSIGMIALKASDCASAAFWFMEAAKQQYGNAQYELGLLYQAGNGVEKNNKRAEYCFQRAYANGCRLGHLADVLPVSEIDEFIDDENLIDMDTLNKPHNLRGKHGNIVKARFKKPSAKTVDIIAEETTHLKDTVQTIRKVITQKESGLYRPVLADVQDKSDRLQYIADYEEMCTVESSISELHGCLADPYFGRMNLLCVDENEFVDMYVGKKAICFNGEFLVHSCWSPIGNKIYDTINTKYSHEEYEYMLQFRRKMQCLNGSLISCVEDYNRGSALLTDSISDSFLLQVLKEKQGAKQLTNIIKTIQSNQNELIRKPLSENLIVQGCAGSGKTMILLHRLASLLYLNPKWNLDAVKIITPSENFNNHIDYLWHDLGIDSIEKLSLQQYYAHCLSGYGINIHKRKNKSMAMRYGNENELDAGLVAYFYSDVFVLKLNEVLPSYKKLLFEKNQKNDKIYKSQMKHYNELRDSGSDGGSMPQKPKPVYPNINDKELTDVMRGHKRSSGVAYQFELYAWLLLLYSCLGANRKCDRYLFIDEGQDVSINEYLLISNLNENVVFNIFGDTNQMISSYRGITDWKTLSGISKFKQYTISQNYRNTTEINDYCNHNFGLQVDSLGLNGKNVESITLAQMKHSLAQVESADNRVAIIADESLHEEIIQMLSGFKNIGQKIFSANSCKGLEFDVTFVFSEHMSQNEKYIAYTRALSELYLISDGVCKGRVDKI